MRDVVLIACGKTKAPVPSPARDLYQGDLFQKCLAYAEKVLNADAIYVLSAKYGLVPINERIEPYEKTLNNASVAEKRDWADRVLAQLREVADLEQDRFTILAGENYRQHLLPHLRYHALPLRGLMFGQQLSFLTRATANV
jgi:cytoplasmic iron level regulating protein YaaA (DUF328/UPF0246 family)